MQYSFFEGNGESTCGAMRKSIDCQPSKLRRFTSQLRNFFPKKKKTLVNRKIQEPSERERFLQEEATGELERVAKDKLYCFQVIKVYEQGLAPVWMSRL